jgi:hypothetical protein
MKLTVSRANFARWAKFINIIYAAESGGMEMLWLRQKPSASPTTRAEAENPLPALT